MLIFRCYRRSDPRALHSFPTRRSSDLTAALEARVAAVAGGLRGAGVDVGDAVSWQLPNSVDAVVLYRDRKSTRLNSSHVETSYAVFCLKKKNTGSFAVCLSKISCT